MTIDEKDYRQNIADARAAGYVDGRRAALEAASEHLKAQSAKWLKVAQDNQHPTDAASRVVAVELACQADIVRALLEPAAVAK